jgi:hypothetical protein
VQEAVHSSEWRGCIAGLHRRIALMTRGIQAGSSPTHRRLIGTGAWEPSATSKVNLIWKHDLGRYPFDLSLRVLAQGVEGATQPLGMACHVAGTGVLNTGWPLQEGRLHTRRLPGGDIGHGTRQTS